MICMDVEPCSTAFVLLTSLEDVIEVEEQDELEGSNRSVGTVLSGYLESFVLVRLFFQPPLLHDASSS